MLASLSQCQALLGKSALTLFYANQLSEASVGETPSLVPSCGEVGRTDESGQDLGAL